MSDANFWIVASAIFGAILGSFLNVVVFRLPRGLSIRSPRWSFCPHCQQRISFRDNVPILGWLLLRGKCRNCAAPIGVVYPLVEAVTALLFVFLADALFAGRTLPFIGEPADDWPIALAYFSLFAALLSTAAMDIESYMVDVRVLIFAMVTGVLGTAIWFVTDASVVSVVSNEMSVHRAPYSPVLTVGGHRPTGFLPPTMAVLGVVAGLCWAIQSFVLSMRAGKTSVAPAGAADGRTPYEEMLPESPSYLKTSGQRFRPAPILLLVTLITAMACWAVFVPDVGFLDSVSPATQRGIIATFILMLLLVMASIVHRESDEQIIDEIEAERSTARRVALQESAGLMAPLLVGLGLLVYWRVRGQLDQSFSEIIRPLSCPASVERLLEGCCQALGALVWSAAIGWFVRIAGTLSFGKEAFGTGDIYIMAAIGPCMGVWGLVFTFFLAAILAIMGVVAMMFWKANRALPFGPWLAMGAFATLWLFQPLLEWFAPIGAILWSLLTGRVADV